MLWKPRRPPVARSNVRTLEERARELAAKEVLRIFMSMSAEELANLAFLASRGKRGKAELAAAFGRRGITDALLEAAVGPDGMRDEALREVRMEDLVRWTVWPRASEIRAARARLEVVGRLIEKPPDCSEDDEQPDEPRVQEVSDAKPG
jgi:hypothetical protein